ncbi:GntR family transcriptional regulator [Actinotalea sp. C106]|uniref:GntR family transcriptional regulator n=1 Tax=Actinotalea sp. C106 TaxID=2908644 RepID=UPI002028A5D2|nr:GntR family transcriptional regulator [Actinotalea sp. C106]
MTVLNRHSTRPLYQQIVDDLETRTADLDPGERLPSEGELAREYDVNRLTVRQALAELTRRGVVETVHGRGTFVAAPTLRYRVAAGRDASFTHAMRERGHAVATTLLKVRTEEDPAVARELRTRGTVRRLDLLRTVDGQPWSVTATWLPVGRLRGIEDHWSGDSSLYDVLLEHHGVRMRRAGRTFAAAPATGQDSEHLLVPVGAPVLLVRGLNVDEKGRPVAVVEHRFRGDRVEFGVDLA